MAKRFLPSSHAVCSASLLNKGNSSSCTSVFFSSIIPQPVAHDVSQVVSCGSVFFAFFRRLRKVSMSTASALSARNAQPIDGIRLPSRSTIKSSSFIFKYSANAFRKAGRNVKGPPQSSMGGVKSHPWLSVVMVCTAMLWKILAAMSLSGRLRDMRFWMSVLANTPHRAAIGYSCLAAIALSFSSLFVLPVNTAI